MRIFIVLLISLTIWSNQTLAGGRNHVRSYYRKDGTYVQGHYRTNPDHSKFNNYGTPGNWNPNKGEISGGDLSKYLEKDNTTSSRRYGYFNSNHLYIKENDWMRPYNLIPTSSYEIEDEQVGSKHCTPQELQLLRQERDRLRAKVSQVNLTSEQIETHADQDDEVFNGDIWVIDESGSNAKKFNAFEFDIFVKELQLSPEQVDLLRVLLHTD